MAGPYVGTLLVIKIDAVAVGVVTVIEIEYLYEGGTVQHVYGTDEGKIPLGGKRCRWRIGRWFKADTDTDLLYDLFDTKTEFDLTTELTGVSNSTAGITDCKASAWRQITGDPNSIVGEEIAGEGISWANADIDDV